MKRDKKQQPIKAKEFAVNPFKALKGMTVEAPPPPPKEVKKEAPLVRADADDRELFLRAMADVQRMRVDRLEQAPPPRQAASAPAPPRPVELFDADDRRIFLETIGRMKMDVTFRDNIPQPGSTATAAPGRMRQLKRGTIRIDFELDLHGLTREEALEALAPFIEGAYRRGQQAVLIITGKGNNSGGEPVLQPAVSSWLRDKGRQMVAEFAQAPRELGGDGALVVFLRSGGK